MLRLPESKYWYQVRLIQARQETEANLLKLLQSSEAWLIANLQMKGITIGYRPEAFDVVQTRCQT